MNDNDPSFYAMSKTIAFLVFDRFQILDATGPMAAFEMPMQVLQPVPYGLRFVSARGGIITSSSGAALITEPFERVPSIDTLIIAGGQGTAAAMRCEATRDFLKVQASTARRLCSVCSGAFILAAAGLLDGRRATTHWNRSGEFGAMFPRVQLESDRIFIRDGHIWTAAGVTAGIDLALVLIEEDLGEAVAKRVAQELVVYYRRPGGQSQFSSLLDLAMPQGRFADLLGWMRENITRPLGVEHLAEQVGMSPRNFSRAFSRELGVSPAKAVERLRLDLARERVEAGVQRISEIAEQTGFHDQERMRRAFMRHFGLPPQAMRRLSSPQ